MLIAFSLYPMMLEGVNGINITSVNSNLSDGLVEYYVFEDNVNNSFGLNNVTLIGQIDEFAVWNRSLENEDIKDLFNKGSGTVYLNGTIYKKVVGSGINDSTLMTNLITNDQIIKYVPFFFALVFLLTIISYIYQGLRSAGMFGGDDYIPSEDEDYEEEDEEEDYELCEMCKEELDEEDSYSCDGCRKTICEDCVEEYKGEDLCRDCYLKIKVTKNHSKRKSNEIKDSIEHRAHVLIPKNLKPKTPEEKIDPSSNQFERTKFDGKSKFD